MIYAFSNPFTPSFVDESYVCYPTKAYTSSKSYTSTCGPDSRIPQITRSANAFSFTSQEDADTIALAAATALALEARAQQPCPNY
jgi:hypothetical protein